MLLEINTEAVQYQGKRSPFGNALFLYFQDMFALRDRYRDADGKISKADRQAFLKEHFKEARRFSDILTKYTGLYYDISYQYNRGPSCLFMMTTSYGKGAMGRTGYGTSVKSADIEKRLIEMKKHIDTELGIVKDIKSAHEQSVIGMLFTLTYCTDTMYFLDQVSDVAAMTPDEATGVILHEIGHSVNNVIMANVVDNTILDFIKPTKVKVTTDKELKAALTQAKKNLVYLNKLNILQSSSKGIDIAAIIANAEKAINDTEIKTTYKTSILKLLGAIVAWCNFIMYGTYIARFMEFSAIKSFNGSNTRSSEFGGLDDVITRKEFDADVYAAMHGFAIGNLTFSEKVNVLWGTSYVNRTSKRRTADHRIMKMFYYAGYRSLIANYGTEEQRFDATYKGLLKNLRASNLDKEIEKELLEQLTAIRKMKPKVMDTIRKSYGMTEGLNIMMLKLAMWPMMLFYIKRDRKDKHVTALFNAVDKMTNSDLIYISKALGQIK